MRMVIHSAPGNGLSLDKRSRLPQLYSMNKGASLVYSHTRPEIRVVRTHEPVPTTIGWSNYESWSFSSNNLVKLVGEISQGNVMSEDGTLQSALLNAGDISGLEGQTKSITGRLSWSDSKGMWCIDVGSNTDSGLGDVMGAEDMLIS